MELKTLNRINRMIDEGHIKKIYVDGWNRIFVNKITELFGQRVDIIEIKYNSRVIDKIEFEKTDCLLLDDVINRYRKADNLIRKAFTNGVFIKILTEDIYDVNEPKIKIDNDGITVNEGTLIIKNKSDMDRFEVWNKQDFIKYCNDNSQLNITTINEYWDKLRKGYNFIFVDRVGKHDMEFYSVDFFNKMFC